MGRAPPASGFGPSEIAVLPIEQVTRDATAFDSVFVDELLGSVAVSRDGSVALLYTTALPLDRVVVLPTSPDEADYLVPRAVGVVAPVDAVFIAPDARHALLALRPAQGSSLGGAFGVVSLERTLPTKVQTTDAPISGVAFAEPVSSSAILTAATGMTAYLVHMPSLRVDRVPLPSLPLSAGIVAEEGIGFVAQKHPDGRLSLIDLESAETRTLTGFELGASVSDGN